MTSSHPQRDKVRVFEPGQHGGPTTAGESAWLLSPDEVAVRLCISRDHAFKLMRAGQLPHVRVGRFYRISETDLRAFVAQARVAAEAPVAVEIRAPRTSALPALAKSTRW